MLKPARRGVDGVLENDPRGRLNNDAGFAFARWLTDEARWSRFVRKIPAQAQLQPPFLKELFKDFAAQSNRRNQQSVSGFER